MGLIGGIARTAVAAGTWTAVSNRVSRRQYDRWAEQNQPSYPEPPPAPAAQTGGGGGDRIGQLKQLAELKSQGILTEEEFAAEKAKILAA